MYTTDNRHAKKLAMPYDRIINDHTAEDYFLKGSISYDILLHGNIVDDDLRANSARLS